MSTCAILFLKEPRPGHVKTRLHSSCTPEEAAELYRAFTLDSVRILSSCSASIKIVAYDPPEAERSIRALVGEGSFLFAAQPPGNLGDRMVGMLRLAVEMGATSIVIIGSDTPSLPPAYVDEALRHLESKELVLGPCTDGGYYLIGQRDLSPGLFERIDWSSGEVLQQTLDRWGDRSLALLPPWYDVDTPADAAFLRVHLEALNRSEDAQSWYSLPVLNRLELPPPS